MRERLVHLLVIVTFGTIFYINSFGNFFVWNDWTLIIENFLIKDWWNLPEIFTSAFWKPLLGEPAQVYRPVFFLSFITDFSLWRLNPWGYHLTNTLLHVLNSVLVYFLMRRYVTPSTALIGSVLFAAHPIHTEAVTYISGRTDLLVSFFLLSGVLLFLQGEKRGSKLLYLSSLPLFFLSLLSKETAVIFPLLLVVAHLTAYPSSLRRNRLRWIALHIGSLATLGLYLILRQYFVGITLSTYALASPDFVPYLLLVLKAIPLYLGLLLFPFNLHFIHRVDLYTSLLDIQLVLAILLLMGTGWGLRRALRSDNQAVVFAVLWFFIGLLPLVYLTGLGLPLLEGWIYLPSLGFFLLVALALSKLQFWTRSRIHIWLTLLIAVLLGSLTFKRNWDWKDEMRISLHTIEASADDPLALRLRGDAYVRRGKTPEAEKLFQKGLLYAPDDPRLNESLGWLFGFMGRDSDALTHYHRIIDLTPKEPYPYWLIGRYYRRKGELAEAEKYLAEAVRLFPYSSELRNNLATVYFFQEKFDAAEAALRAAMKILPYSPILQDNLEKVLTKIQTQ